MAYQVAATAVTLNDLEGHSPVAYLFKCSQSNICAALYTMLTDGVLAWFLCISRAFCTIKTRPFRALDAVFSGFCGICSNQ